MGLVFPIPAQPLTQSLLSATAARPIEPHRPMERHQVAPPAATFVPSDNLPDLSAAAARAYAAAIQKAMAQKTADATPLPALPPPVTPSAAITPEPSSMAGADSLASDPGQLAEPTDAPAQAQP